MNRQGPGVKPARAYDSSRRREQARKVQARVVDVAREMFLQHGYGATTVAAVGAAAGVSVESIYKTFGGKPGLVRAIQEAGLAGVGAVPAPERSDALSARAISPAAIVRGWATLAAEVTPRVAPIMLLVRSAAASDPDMAVLQEQLSQQRLERMTHNARRLAEHGHLRKGLSIENARDVMYTYTAPELYELLVLSRGWALEAFGDFVYRGLVAELLEEASPAGLSS